MKKYILYSIILIIIFNLLLFLVSIFPSNWIEKNVEETSEILLEQDNYYSLPIVNVIINNYTDSIMINTAYSIDNKNPVFSYMSARKNYKEGLTQETQNDTNGELISINNLEKYDPVRRIRRFLKWQNKYFYRICKVLAWIFSLVKANAHIF